MASVRDAFIATMLLLCDTAKPIMMAKPLLQTAAASCCEDSTATQ